MGKESLNRADNSSLSVEIRRHVVIAVFHVTFLARLVPPDGI